MKISIFRKIYALSVGFKNESSKKKRFPVLRQKTDFAVKLPGRSNDSFSVDLIKQHLQTFVLFNI